MSFSRPIYSLRDRNPQQAGRNNYYINTDLVKLFLAMPDVNP
jgi:hypothetical protein